MEKKAIFYLEQITRLYKQRGIRSLSMEDIANHVGVSKKTLYNYFESKELMINTLLQQLFQNIKFAFGKISQQPGNAITRLLQVSDLLHHLYGEFPAHMIHDLNKLFPYLSHKNKDAYQSHLYNEIKKNIGQGIEQGLYLPTLEVNLIAHYFVFSLQQLLTNSFNTPPETSAANNYKQLVNYHIRGLATEKGLQFLSNYSANASSVLISNAY